MGEECAWLANAAEWELTARHPAHNDGGHRGLLAGHGPGRPGGNGEARSAPVPAFRRCHRGRRPARPRRAGSTRSNAPDRLAPTDRRRRVAKRRVSPDLRAPN